MPSGRASNVCSLEAAIQADPAPMIAKRSTESSTICATSAGGETYPKNTGRTSRSGADIGPGPGKTSGPAFCAFSATTRSPPRQTYMTWHFYLKQKQQPHAKGDKKQQRNNRANNTRWPASPNVNTQYNKQRQFKRMKLTTIVCWIPIRNRADKLIG